MHWYSLQTGDGDLLGTYDTLDEALAVLTQDYYTFNGGVPSEPERMVIVQVDEETGAEQNVYDTETYADNSGVLGFTCHVAAWESDTSGSGIGIAGFDWFTDEATARARHEENVRHVCEHGGGAYFIPDVHLEMWQGDNPTSVLDLTLWGDLFSAPGVVADVTGRAQSVVVKNGGGE